MKKILLITIFLLLSQLTLSASPVYSTSANACYKSREIVYPYQDVFDALKQTIMQSNLNIVTVTKNDGIITAKGSAYNEEEETIISITLTVNLNKRGDSLTSVKVIASYDTQEKKNDSGQLGGAGISLPIPVPFTGKYTVVSSGNIDDPMWYQGFFSSLDKILFENYMKYGIDKTTTSK